MTNNNRGSSGQGSSGQQNRTPAPEYREQRSPGANVPTRSGGPRRQGE